ncbi:hypothetical protein P43SY_006023 [Pythium insidiosum]|uniref:Uncharacterized protein n=1 Tax=Pythium insidiosum TaxID=114742 RepID=A0AAD5M1M5_PYTIN|nr:hypothetical protein P43SY_006023 [Pythium insidiosum]
MVDEEDDVRQRRSNALSLLKKKLGRLEHRVARAPEQPETPSDEDKHPVPTRTDQPPSRSPARARPDAPCYCHDDQPIERRQQDVIVRAPSAKTRVSQPVPPYLNDNQAHASDSHDSDTGAMSQQQPPQQQQRPATTKLVVKWSCTRCQRECIPVREESRCLWYSTGSNSVTAERQPPTVEAE